jgi:hypothetical protein
LSPSQKKANHIQSEQKRRANIRRGYEALCDTVPALREAIREEEEAEAKMNHDMESGSSGKLSRSKRKRKDAGVGDADRTDGRAGPRSENVVLLKSMCLCLSALESSVDSLIFSFKLLSTFRTSSMSVQLF